MSNKNVLKRWFEEVWNQGREEAIDELSSPDVVAHGLFDAQGEEVSGREKFKIFWRRFRTAFPDATVEVNDEFAEGEKVVARCTVRATHKGEGMGIPPSQKPICFSGMIIAQVADGRLQEVWDSWDFLTLYQQIGALPAALMK